jgi:hypothetical protein
MRKLFGIALIVLGLICAAAMIDEALAANVRVTFEWDANTEADLAGYRLYKSATSGQYTYGAANAAANFGKVATGAVDLDNVEEGSRIYFVLTAFDLTGNESGASNEVVYTVGDVTPPAPPKNFLAKLWQLIHAWLRGLSIVG